MPRVNRAALAAAYWIADAQDGLITAAQAQEAGLSTSTLCHRARHRGPWQRPHPAVYALHSGPLTERMQLRAALLYAGQPAMLTGAAVLGAYGLRRVPAFGVHLLIPNDRNVSNHAGVLVERTRRWPEADELDGFPTAPLPRAIVDAARRMGRRGDVDALVGEAVQRGMVQPGDLLREVRDAQVRGTALVRAAATAALDGAHSGPEMDLRSVLSASGLPAPLFNVDLCDSVTGRFIARPDAYWREGVALEVDSREHHTVGTDFDRTLDRDADLTSYGILTLHVTPRRLGAAPRVLIQRLSRTLEVARTRPRPAVTVRGDSN